MNALIHRAWRDSPGHASALPPADSSFVPGRASRVRHAAVAIAVLCIASVGVPFSNAHAQTPPDARVRPCTQCHGPQGIATAPDAPHLAGQPEMYLTAQLRAYRSGVRQHPVMNVIAKPLSDDDIAALAAWFSAIRIEVQAR